MQNFRGRTAFITGGAGGIGFALASAALAEGMNVVLTDRSQADAEAAAVRLGDQARTLALAFDVTDREAFAQARDAALGRFGAVHLLCNNAGVGGGAAIDVAEYVDWDWMLDINLGGVINGIVTFLPTLRKVDEAHILNTSSVAGLFMTPDPVYGIYSVSKAAVRTLSESLRWSLQGTSIGVTALCPGFVRSGIARTDRLHPSVIQGTREANLELEAMIEGMMEVAGMDPAIAAQIALDAIRRNLPFALTHGQFGRVAAEYAGVLADAFDDAGDTFDGSAEGNISAMEAIRLAERVRY